MLTKPLRKRPLCVHQLQFFVPLKRRQQHCLLIFYDFFSFVVLTLSINLCTFLPLLQIYGPYSKICTFCKIRQAFFMPKSQNTGKTSSKDFFSSSWVSQIFIKRNSLVYHALLRTASISCLGYLQSMKNQFNLKL